MREQFITEEARAIERYVNEHWRQFTTRLEVPLSEIFPEPENRGLKHIWRYGSADLVVYRDGKPLLIIEPGGSHHWDEKPSLNDRRKWKLAEINKVRCLGVVNGLMAGLSRRKWRALLGRYLFGPAQYE